MFCSGISLCEDLIIDCVFEHEFYTGHECCGKHFSTVLGTLGLTFEISRKILQNREAVSAGIGMNFRVPLQQLSLDWDYMNNRATVLHGGLRIHILSDDKGYDSEVSSLVPVASGERTMVAVTYIKHDNTGLHQSIVPWWDSSLSCTPSHAPYEERAVVGQKGVDESRRNTCNEGANVTEVSRLFQVLVEAIVNALSPTVERRVDGMTRSAVDAERNRLLEGRYDTRCRHSVRKGGARPNECHHEGLEDRPRTTAADDKYSS
ncbi:uncharacterized protein LOC125179352 [Hyalella azteca]|uniref:Uncharacterized protein LOC125179352 n=1 Tax=Hyalella azteca TaxID=294128 RepID=A0A979FWX5_HYAAZ|nr:uncharacterized protein LOC125179352 [Hyalella azteca]